MSLSCVCLCVPAPVGDLYVCSLEHSFDVDMLLVPKYLKSFK